MQNLAHYLDELDIEIVHILNRKQGCFGTPPSPPPKKVIN